jgi:succinate-semialdehyde dehydrogenase / glutarate-semialdehyde dehydrogenase
MLLQSINPYNQEIIHQCEEFSPEVVCEVLEASQLAFEKWRFTSISDRAGYMKKLAELLTINKEPLARVITLEMGKPIRESIAEIEKCAWACNYFLKNAPRFLKPQVIKSDAQHSRIVFEPIGPILGIMPWNFPFWQVFRFLAPTLMAGNTALLKHASNVQLCAQEIEKLFVQSGFPPNVFRNLRISSKNIQSVISNKYIKAITLTGSEKAGSAAAAEAGRNIKKSVLELGGSNAFIVLEDADIGLAVNEAVKARMQNAGQSCISAKRFIVHEKIADEFANKFVQRINKLNVGNPLAMETEIGPLSNISQAMEVERQVNESIKMGAYLITGGKRADAFYAPTLLTQVTMEMPVFKEEVFGPVAVLMKFSEELDAIDLANASEFGLGTSIFTKDIKHAEKLIPLLEDGSVFINSLVKSDPRLPFGGTKKSGYGRELSRVGMLEFVNIKTIFIQ